MKLLEKYGDQSWIKNADEDFIKKVAEIQDYVELDPADPTKELASIDAPIYGTATEFRCILAGYEITTKDSDGKDIVRHYLKCSIYDFKLLDAYGNPLTPEQTIKAFTGSDGMPHKIDISTAEECYAVYKIYKKEGKWEGYALPFAWEHDLAKAREKVKC